MKKFYSLLSLLMLALVSFNVSASKTVTIYCSAVESIEVRDGSATGSKLAVEANPATVTFESDALYIGLTDDSKNLASVAYTGTSGYYESATITGDYCIIPLASMNSGDVDINITIQAPTIVTLNVPDPSLITVKKESYNTDEFTLTAGANKLKLDTYPNLYVEVKDPENWKLTKFYRVSDNQEYTVNQYRSCELYSYQMNAGDEFSYTLVPASEFQAPTFTLTVDHPELADISIDYQTINGIVANEPYSYEMSSSTASLQIYTKNGAEIYQVTQNGNVVPDSYGSYYFTASVDDNIVVTFDFPEVYSNVTITSDPAENIDFITDIKIGGESVENWKETFPGQVNKKMEFNFDTAKYKFIGMTINGEAVTNVYGSSWSTKVTDADMNIVVTSEKYPTLTATLHVEDPESIDALLNRVSTPLVAGENTIEFTEVSSYLTINQKSGYVLDKVSTVIGEDVKEENISYGSCQINLVEGMIIFVESHALVMDQRAVIYSTHNSDDETFNRFYFQNRYDYSTYDVKAGYSYFDFTQIFNPFGLSVADKETYDTPSPTSVYINGEEVRYYYGYEFSLNNGDVLKMFFYVDPATYTATFNVADGCEIEVVKDLIVPVEDLTAGVTDFEGTAIQIKNANAEKSIEVYVAAAEDAAAEGDDDNAAGTKLEADENGYYNVTLDGSKTITVSLAKQDGVESVNAAAVTESRDVYTLTGILLISNATDAQLKALPAGIYVVGGQKLVIR